MTVAVAESPLPAVAEVLWATPPGPKSPPRAAASPLRPWLDAQAINVDRHRKALRPFTREEFGTGAAAPSDGHILAVNELLERLRKPLRQMTSEVGRAAASASADPNAAALARLLRRKSKAHDYVRATEKVWDFYFEMFGQRQSPYADWLLSCDRVALDCYQHTWVNLGSARSVPAPPPFAYMRTGFSPATFRRGIPLRRLGRQINPVPIVQLPYHRLVNPWTLGAMLHEVSHNLQNELELDVALPQRLRRRLEAAGMPPAVVATWVRWNRESFADLCGVLFGGESFVGSLMDVLGRDPRLATAFSPRGLHPTPYLRTFISCRLLDRLGFSERARQLEHMWRRLYPPSTLSGIPKAMLASFAEAMPIVVDAICFERYRSLGNRSLAEVLRLEPKDEQMIAEAAARLARGTDPGVVPARYLISAVRVALDRRLASPETLMKNFYTELARR